MRTDNAPTAARLLAEIRQHHKEPAERVAALLDAMASSGRPITPLRAWRYVRGLSADRVAFVISDARSVRRAGAALSVGQLNNYERDGYIHRGPSRTAETLAIYAALATLYGATPGQLRSAATGAARIEASA